MILYNFLAPAHDHEGRPIRVLDIQNYPAGRRRNRQDVSADPADPQGTRAAAQTHQAAERVHHAHIQPCVCGPDLGLAR